MVYCRYHFLIRFCFAAQGRWNYLCSRKTTWSIFILPPCVPLMFNAWTLFCVHDEPNLVRLTEGKTLLPILNLEEQSVLQVFREHCVLCVVCVLGPQFVPLHGFNGRWGTSSASVSEDHHCMLYWS